MKHHRVYLPLFGSDLDNLFFVVNPVVNPVVIQVVIQVYKIEIMNWIDNRLLGNTLQLHHSMSHRISKIYKHRFGCLFSAKTMITTHNMIVFDFVIFDEPVNDLGNHFERVIFNMRHLTLECIKNVSSGRINHLINIDIPMLSIKKQELDIDRYQT